MFHEELLDFPVIEGHYTGENFTEMLKKTLRYYEIYDKLTSLTIDNAGNNGTLFKGIVDTIS